MIPWLITIFVLVGLILAYYLVSLFFVFFMTKKFFGVRGEDPDNPCYLRFEDYQSFLKREPIRIGFYGQAIKGYIYEDKNRADFKGFIILAHGFFGTHIQYLVDIAFLARLGYRVLAFDQYGVGLSEGRNQLSFANGIYVLENVIHAVEKEKMNGDLPIYLYGHSWGAYSVAGALKHHPEIEKAVMRSGFVSPLTVLLDFLKGQNQALYVFLRPMFTLCFVTIFGFRHIITAKRGLKKNHKTKCLVVHAKDDPMVLFNHSLASYCQKHPESQREVVVYPSGGHNTLITVEAVENYNRAVREYEEIQAIEDDKEKTRKLEEYLSKLDRVSMYPYRADMSELLKKFLED